MKRICLLSAVLSVFAAGDATAQELEPGRVAVGILGGRWSTESHKRRPFVLVTADYVLSRAIVIEASAGAAQLKTRICGDGEVDPSCNENKAFRTFTVMARFEPTQSGLRPYVGASLGRTWFFEASGVFCLHAGLTIVPLRDSGARFDTAFH